MLKISHAGCLSLSAISSQFSVEMCVTSKNCEKFTKPFGGSRSFKVVDVDTSKKPITSACYDKQHVCTYLQPFSHYTSQQRQNNVFLGGYLSSTPSFEGNPRTQEHEILSQKTRDLVAAHGEDIVILLCTVLIQLTSVTDRRTGA